MNTTLLKPVLPKEHGVLVIGFVPLLTALAISFQGFGQSHRQVMWFTGAVIFFFMGFSPLISIIKKEGNRKNSKLAERNSLWTAIYFSLSLLFFYILLTTSKLWGLLAFLVPIVGVFLFYCRLLVLGENRDHFVMDILGATALCLIAPMAYFVSLQRLDITALMLYTINTGFFSSRIIFAKQMINLKENDPALENFKSRRKYFKKVSIFNLIIIHVLVVFSVMKMIPALAVTSLLPGSIYTWKQIMSLKQKPKIREVGFKEMGVATFFCVVLIFSYSMGWPLK